MERFEIGVTLRTSLVAGWKFVAIVGVGCREEGYGNLGGYRNEFEPCFGVSLR